MGLFNFLKYNNIEKILLHQYTHMIGKMMNIPMIEAKKIATGLIDKAIDESKKEGTYYLPPNFGDIILGDVKNNEPFIKKIIENIRKTLPNKKYEGVNDEDIRWWWNLNDVERQIMLDFDEISRFSHFEAKLELNNDEKQAINSVRKFFPIFGNPEDNTYTTGEDTPLPIELKDRINIYIEKRRMDSSEKFKIDIEQSSSFNALIRKEIKAKNL